ncbi:hypothetical protein [Aquimarina litoralis]|uniref:hypothetical protein n=1 Tax=Aquimarina litoralis TaxID=584605 RepID=UPI001C5A4D5A|nr:hypothetical protein [Aquimarina litoralis]MBW1297924.1 hypothetical protein [Aquimarina litoralis]
MKKVIIYLILTIGSTAIGVLTHKYFLDFSFSLLNKRNVTLVASSVGIQFKNHLFFIVSMGIFPLLYLISEKFTRPKSPRRIMTNLALILGTGIVCWLLKIFQLNNLFKKLSAFNIAFGVQNTMDIQNLNFGKYLFIGLLIGTLLSILIFRKKNTLVEE